MSEVQEEHLRLLSERVERRLVEIVVSRFMHLDSAVQICRVFAARRRCDVRSTILPL